MVSKKVIDKQLKKLKFNTRSWGRAEVQELPKVILPDEEIYELVNGVYEGGFALLVATNIRVLLIDKKPMNFLTVEDLRFDMINEIDYNHRLMGAHISISAGSKNLKFTSYNQPRLRKLINHVQHCMAESKKKQSDHQVDQNSHLEQINQQLQAYLIAQHQQQEQLREKLESKTTNDAQPGAATAMTPLKPSPELADYLLAQNLLREYREQKTPLSPSETSPPPAQPATVETPAAAPDTAAPDVYSLAGMPQSNNSDDLKAAAEAEIFGTPAVSPSPIAQTAAASAVTAVQSISRGAQKLIINPSSFKGLEVNPLRVAYAKLPLALRNRKFGRPSFHAHSQAVAQPPEPTLPTGGTQPFGVS